MTRPAAFRQAAQSMLCRIRGHRFETFPAKFVAVLGAPETDTRGGEHGR